MARGWESKSVEQQQEEAATQKISRAPLSPEQIARESRRQGLELSRQRILQQLQAACNSRHRQMLEAALAELDRRIEEFPR
jgi:hypothetical protein